MKYLIFLFGIFFLLINPSYSSEASDEGTSLFIENIRIQIVNATNGEIKVSKNKGISWEVIGHVLSPAKRLNEKGFTASTWAGTYEIAATSVNAIHIKISEPKTIFSILPVEFYKKTDKYRSYFSSDSSIYTDILASKKIFGGGLSPFLGNKVIKNNSDYVPILKEGDVFTVIVDRPVKYPKEIVFENWFGGKIFVTYPDSLPVIIGEVLKPVYGVGRFEGSRYLNPGRIRANHPGVIDISTAPKGLVGGFQIIPAKHSLSSEMASARFKTQWMIVSGKSVYETSQEGTAPLFKYFLKPQYDSDDLNNKNWQKSFLKRFLVQVSLKNENKWKPMPVYGLNPYDDLPPEADRFLENVQKIRILFPDLKDQNKTPAF